MKTKKTVFKAFVNHEKEEAFLNEMNVHGWKLVSVRFAFYAFEKTEPNQYKTILHFAERQYQKTCLRTVTECGCDIAHRSNEGKFILYYINVPVDFESSEFLSDNQSKLDFKKRLNITRKREFGALFVVFAISVLPGLCTLPSIFKILNTNPEELYKIIREDLLGFIFFAIFIICGIVCGVMTIYLLKLYFHTKQEIRAISNEMKIFE